MYRTPDRRWRIEVTTRRIRVFAVGAGGGQFMAYECRTPAELEGWLNKHAGVCMSELAQD